MAKSKTVKKNSKSKAASSRASTKKVLSKKANTKKAPARKVLKPAKKKAAPKVQAKTKSVVKKVAASSPRPTRAYGMSEQLLEAAIKVLDERQAEEVFTVDLAGKSSMADYLIIASGRASRQLSAISHYLREAFEKLGIKNIRVEGLADANWVLVDAGDVIVHLFRPEVRSYYNLESIWSGGGTAKSKTRD